MNRIASGSLRRALALAALIVCVPLFALAGSKDPNHRLEQRLRMVEQEKARLSQQMADAQNQIKDAQDKAKDAEQRAGAAGHRNARLAREFEALKAEKEALAASSKADHDALAARLADIEHQMADQRRQLEAMLAHRGNELASCRERNDRMYKLGNELLDKYEQKGCFDAALQAEPFTGLKRAQIEKMVEEDREKLDDAQILPSSANAATASTR